MISRMFYPGGESSEITHYTGSLVFSSPKESQLSHDRNLGSLKTQVK